MNSVSENQNRFDNRNGNGRFKSRKKRGLTTEQAARAFRNLSPLDQKRILEQTENVSKKTKLKVGDALAVVAAISILFVERPKPDVDA